MFYLNKGGGVSTIKDLDDLDDLTEDDLEKQPSLADIGWPIRMR